jgi:DNA polymerase-1
MDALALKYLGHRTIHFEDVAGKGAKQVTFDQVGIDEAAAYAAEDADITLRLHQELYPRLEKIAGPKRVFHDIEMPLIGVLSRMERTGVLVDRQMLRTQSKELAERLLELEAEAHTEAGGPFNLGSPKQIQEILFDKLQLPVLEKTPKGQPSTAESVLEQLAENYALPRIILTHRGLAKLKSTYTDKLPELINPRTGRVHTSYQQAVASTGRLSSSDPNLQNIPIRSAEGRRIRQAFTAAPGYKLLSADYSQVELRIMAHLSGDEGLKQAFASGQDIHRATAAEVFDAGDPASVTGEQRRAAKAINFGLIYGMSAFGLARQLGVGRPEAARYIELYFQRYPGVRAFMDRTREQAREDGYVETVMGRRLYLPEINSRNAGRRQAAERTAINAPLQGTAADIIKRAMLGLDAWLSQAHPDVRMVLQVHDELVFEVPEAKVEELRPRICERMQAAAELAVPLEVEAGVGQNWGEAH